MAENKGKPQLKLKSIIGFDGNAPKSLRLHPDNKHIVYPFGIKIAASNLQTKEQFFFEGHTNVISCLSISNSGKYLASGQINFLGFKAPVIVWDWEKKKEVMTHDSHKVRVESVVFSSCETYVMSLGGRDDANLIVFNIHTREPICGVFSSNHNAGDAVLTCPMNKRGICLMTGGACTLKVWTLNPKARSVRGVDVNMGKIRRKYTCIEVDDDDHYAYCGTSTGDIVKIKLNFSSNIDDCDPVAPPAIVGCYGKYGKALPDGSIPIKPILYSQGVRQILLLKGRKLIVGSGSGLIELLQESEPIIPLCKLKLGLPTTPLYVKLKSAKVGGLVTSMQKWDSPKGSLIIVGTVLCEMLLVNVNDFSVTLMVTCHTTTIFDIAFPRDYSEVFATASKDTVRLWSISMGKELLRIAVPNFTCSSVLFTYDGRAIITGWNDGMIRAFTPQSGRLIFTIKDAHNKGVSALAITKDGRKIISGGTEGQIRLWTIYKEHQDLQTVLKEHKGPVSSIDVSPNNKEAASASTDGTVIIWDLEKTVRLAILFSSTLFTCVRYHPSGVQILTCGTNRQIAYWELWDAQLIREVEGSMSSALNGLDIAIDGVHFITVANDQVVKVWRYQEGRSTHVGLGHGAVVTTVRISPDMRHIVTCSADGAILIWESPFSPDLASAAAEEVVGDGVAVTGNSPRVSTDKPNNGAGDESTRTAVTKKKTSSSAGSVKAPSISSGGKPRGAPKESSCRASRRSSSSCLGRKSIESVIDIDQRQSVGVVPNTETETHQQPATDQPKAEGGSIKCYCAAVCACKSESLPNTPKSPKNAGGRNSNEQDNSNG